MKTLENISYIILLISLCALTFISVVVWHSFIATLLCIVSILLWVKAIEHKED